MEAKSENILKACFDRPEIGPAFRLLRLFGTTGAWTAFECLATDAWVTALNARPLSLGQRALTVSPEGGSQDGLTSKQVSVKLLAKYGFDLRAHMGTVLKPKFDLTSLSNITRAYNAAFGKYRQLDEVFDSRDLDLLEASRHVIVHRAGIVDEEFRSRTKRMDLDYPLGIQLPLDGKTVSRLANSAIEAGCRLIAFVDDWLVHNSE